MAYSIDEIIRLMNETAKLKLKEVSIENGNQKIVINGADVQYVAAAESAAAVVVSQPAVSAAEPVDVVTSGPVVTSPMVGVFYAAPGPEAAPFVSVGDEVKKGQVLCIVEAMKLMNEIECEYNGRIAKVLVENGQMVEYGQPLFEIE